MQFYQELETILTTGEPSLKADLFFRFMKHYKENRCSFESSHVPKEFTMPSYVSICRVVSPRDVPKRSNLTTKQGQVHLLHAVAHIEYSAIDLALDICYRFPNMPKAFYDDWLEVVQEEIAHFQMIESLLERLGAKYGDIPVHSALFEASQKTNHSLLERLAVVPRYLEANGLDATPAILQKLQTLPESEILNSIKSVLKRILNEEVEHVRKGDYWFSYVCKKVKKPKEQTYKEIIGHYYPQGFSRIKQLNAKARLEAGFTCSELESLLQRKVCKNENI